LCKNKNGSQRLTHENNWLMTQIGQKTLFRPSGKKLATLDKFILAKLLNVTIPKLIDSKIFWHGNSVSRRPMNWSSLRLTIAPYSSKVRRIWPGIAKNKNWKEFRMWHRLNSVFYHFIIAYHHHHLPFSSSRVATIQSRPQIYIVFDIM
jgi:hypothetical protein